MDQWRLIHATDFAQQLGRECEPSDPVPDACIHCSADTASDFGCAQSTSMQATFVGQHLTHSQPFTVYRNNLCAPSLQPSTEQIKMENIAQSVSLLWAEVQ